ADDLEQLAETSGVARPEPRAMAQRSTLPGLAVLGRRTRDVERAWELRTIERREHDGDRERPRPRTEQRLVQIGIERGELLFRGPLRQIGVRPEPLQRTRLRLIGIH